MITIFHGVNTPSSRKAFINAKENAQNPVTVDGAKVTLTDLAQVLSGEALFAEEHNLFIEEFYSKRKKGKDTETLIDFIVKHEKENNIYIWESKELTASQEKFFKGANIQKFDLPKHIFAFLENLVPGNAAKAIALFHKTLETEEAEFVFFMIVRHFRILLALTTNNVIPAHLSPLWGKAGIYPLTSSSENGSPMESVMTDNANSQIDEVKRMAPWLKGKTAKQANSFSTDSLRNLYNQLFTIEKGLKTGRLATTLPQAIDFWLVSI